MVQGEELCYINGETRLVVIDRKSSYADLVTRVANIFAVSGNFYIKNQLPEKKPDCLITISSVKTFGTCSSNMITWSIHYRLLMSVYLFYKMSSPRIGALSRL